jgi:hypothetical protein
MIKKILFAVIIILLGIVFFTSDVFLSKKVIEAPVITDTEEILLDETLLVENYIREHIVTIAPEEPVLGGTFYVIDVTVNEQNKNGGFVYEDGHIQGQAVFEYSIQNNAVVLQNIQKVE